MPPCNIMHIKHSLPTSSLSLSSCRRRNRRHTKHDYDLTFYGRFSSRYMWSKIVLVPAVKMYVCVCVCMLRYTFIVCGVTLRHNCGRFETRTWHHEKTTIRTTRIMVCYVQLMKQINRRGVNTRFNYRTCQRRSCRSCVL